MENNLFLKEVSLSGYKSINDVNIEFQKGLNIIIGKNAAGKTNFLKFLDKSLTFEFDDLNNFSSNLFFKNGKEISIKNERNLNIEDIFKKSNFNTKLKSEVKISNKLIKLDNDNTILDKLKEINILFDSTFLNHGLPNDYLIVDKPFNFSVESDGILINSSELMNVISNHKTTYFIKCFLLNLFFSIINLEDFKIESLKKEFKSVFSKTESIKDYLKKYTPIEDIKFSDNYNFFVSKKKDKFTLSNLFLEFKIDGNWLPFSNLSDGTKRLFYIISEVVEINDYTGYKPSIWGFSNSSSISRIVLIEEPELGIHPHQFNKLMRFLKEQSENKQIVITTHSPQTLDAINPNELNRIIIAYSTNSLTGTKLRHLNENEILKANEYIKEDFLSDYWLYSDLEK